MAPQNLQPLPKLIQECSRDIRWELEQVRNRITSEDINRMTDALLSATPPAWPAALIELQKGHLLHRLTRHLNFHLRQYYGKDTLHHSLSFSGPFPSFSLKPVLPVAQQFRRTIRTAKCIEFVGNKLWGKALGPIMPKFMPVEIPTATLLMKAHACSPDCELDAARADLSRRVQGLLINCLLAWEKLLIEHTTQFILNNDIAAEQPGYIAETAV